MKNITLIIFVLLFVRRGANGERFGFSVDITPDPWEGRTDLRIHPDGGLPSTQGCIGLSGDLSDVRDFANRIQPYLTTYGTMELCVNYGGNIEVNKY